MTRRRLLTGGLVAAGTIGSTAFAHGTLTRFGAATGAESARRVTPQAERGFGRLWSVETIGWSVEGRPIEVHANVGPQPRTSVMVVTAVHGDERATLPVGRAIVTTPPPDGVAVFVVPAMNPDGWERGTRLNANGVDLNRNFPFGWSARDGGPAPASEPETRALIDTIERLRPGLVVWIHQPYGYVSAISETSDGPAAAWAQHTGLELRPGINQHGGGETWTSRVARLPSILVEMPAETGEAAVEHHRGGYAALLGAV
jgi:hypothetical protein